MHVHYNWFVTVGSIATVSAAFGEGGGRIALNNVGCSGSEERLVNCPSIQATATACRHSHDAGVRCHQQTGTV